MSSDCDHEHTLVEINGNEVCIVCDDVSLYTNDT